MPKVKKNKIKKVAKKVTSKRPKSKLTPAQKAKIAQLLKEIERI